MNNKETILVGKFTKNHYNLLVDRQEKLNLLDIKTYSIMEDDKFYLYVDFDNTRYEYEETKMILHHNGFQFS